MSGDFSIGSTRWAGISKLIEECGEVVQVCGKLIGSRGNVHHWDGTNLKERLEDEMGDVLAAISFVTSKCSLDHKRIAKRQMEKLALFRKWHGEQGTSTSEDGSGDRLTDAVLALLEEVYVGDGQVICPPALIDPVRMLVKVLRERGDMK